MSNLILLQPLVPASITSTRGSGAANAASPDPKEVWADNANGEASLIIDLGVAKPIDTLFIGFHNGVAAASCS